MPTFSSFGRFTKFNESNNKLRRKEETLQKVDERNRFSHLYVYI